MQVACVAVCYFAAGRLGLLLELPGTNASPVWPPSGIGLAAVMVLGSKIWPGIMLGAFLTNLTTLPHTLQGFMASAGICVGNTLEHIVALTIVAPLLADWHPFKRSRNVPRFIFAAATSCAVASTLGTTSLYLTNIISVRVYGTVWFTWWLGDTAGMLVLAPAIYGWWRQPRLELPFMKKVELLALLLVSIAIAELLFGGWIASEVIDSLPYLVVPALLWAAFRFGTRETATVAVLISIVAVWHTWDFMEEVRGVAISRQIFAPFVSPTLSPNESLIMLQTFVCAVSLTAMTLAAAVAQRRHAEAATQRTAAALKVINEELQRKNDEIQQFVYTVSHDLKSPLVTCRGFIGIIREDAESRRWEDMLESITRLDRSTKRMVALIEDLLQLCRIGVVRNEPEEVDVHEMCVGIIESLRSRIDEAGVAVSINGQLPMVVADRVRLGEVFENLLTNAIKYGSRVESPEITIGSDLQDDEVRFFVRDNGPGIAAEFHEDIFSLFRRLEVDQEGTGVGLAAVSRIMEVHGGTASVVSAPGEGATFWVKFPQTPHCEQT